MLFRYMSHLFVCSANIYECVCNGIIILLRSGEIHSYIPESKELLSHLEIKQRKGETYIECSDILFYLNSLYHRLF